MKRAIFALILIAAVAGGIFYWTKTHGTAAAPAAPVEEESKITITHDANGNVVVNIDDEAQGNIGIVVAHPTAYEAAPELKAYGRVIDPSPIAALVNELASAQAAAAASAQEFERTKSLLTQGNTSTRALQTAEAAATHDQLAVRSARDRLMLSWGKEISAQDDLPAFAQSLTSLEAALVRIDLPGGERLAVPPTEVRLITLGGATIQAQFLATALSVDAQFQGQGFLFLVKPNQPRLLPGEALTGYLKIPGETLSGVIIPREAVIRTEGAAWIYVMNQNAESLTRTEIPLDHPTAAGWFVPKDKGVTPENHIVVTGAQTLLSQELKASLKPD